MQKCPPYSEALFCTLKYTPPYPDGPFASLEDVRAWVARTLRALVQHHSAIQFLTPDQRHRGEDSERLRQRAAVYEAAKARHPARWRGDIRNWEPVGPVSLNPGKPSGKEDKTQTT